jgi:hypothetical protein
LLAQLDPLMKKSLLIALMVPVTAVIFSSCAAVTGKLATPERIAQLPEPLRSQLKEMIRQQNAMAAKFTSGTKKMLDAYGMIADAIGLKDVAAKLRAESQALNAGSSLADTRKAISRSDGLMKEVRSKMSSSNNVTAVSKEKFNQGIRTKNEAYMIEHQIGIEAGVQAIKGLAAMAKASPIDKVMLTATLDPLFFFARDIPRFQEQERKFDEICKEYAKNRNIQIPTQALPTPKATNTNY